MVVKSREKCIELGEKLYTVGRQSCVCRVEVACCIDLKTLLVC